jgi:hypothetical protein
MHSCRHRFLSWGAFPGIAAGSRACATATGGSYAWFTFASISRGRAYCSVSVKLRPPWQSLDMRKHVPPEGRASARPRSRPQPTVSVQVIHHGTSRTGARSLGVIFFCLRANCDIAAPSVMSHQRLLASRWPRRRRPQILRLCGIAGRLVICARWRRLGWCR